MAISRCGYNKSAPRSGKILILMAILLPSLFGIVGLVIDGGLIMSDYRNLQHAADSASTAAAMNLAIGKSSDVAIDTANEIIHVGNELADAAVTIHIPPSSGAYAGQAGHVEVIVEREYHTRFMRVLQGFSNQSIRARSVAGVGDVTDSAAIVVLDPDPADVSYPSTAETLATVDETNVADEASSQSGAGALLSSVPVVGSIAASLVNTKLAGLMPDVVSDLLDDVIANIPATAAPTITAGLEIEGLGQLIVEGAIHVNTEWGGVDENGDPAGSAAGPPYAVACMPILPTTQVRARDIRVVGGVDNQDNYLPVDPADSNPLQANRLPVDDPFAHLPIPSTVSDASNVDPTVHDPADLVRVAISAADATQLANEVLNQLPALFRPLFQPLIQPLTELLTQSTIEPGVYNSITVLSPLGGASFEPGVYIIRGTSPATNASLCILGPVEAEGVLFYITNSTGFDAATGQPDAAEDPTAEPPNPVMSLAPSVVISSLLAGGQITGLNDPSSPFNGMLIYQKRSDRRPIVIEAQQLIGSGDIAGAIYSKWGHTIFIGGAGSYDLRFATGTMRVVTVFNSTIAPTIQFPPARDVLLLE